MLLRHVLQIDRAAFFAGLQDEVPGHVAAELDRLLQRRIAREPLAYITGRREFYAMEFSITPAVLVPRQETELLVDLAVERIGNRLGCRVLDIGTGSGCVALAIATHAPDAEVHAIDLSDEALAVAARNRQAHGLADRVTLHRGDLLEPFLGSSTRFDLIVSNPPYIPSAVLDTLSPEVRAEPGMALDGGADGLDSIRELLVQSQAALAEGGRLLIEVYSDSAQETGRLARASFPQAPVALHDDLLGLPRVLEVGPVNG